MRLDGFAAACGCSREPTAERTIPPSLSSSAAVVRTLLTPKIKGRAAPFIFGGRRGIRTPGGFHLNGFQDRRDRPLRHPSVSAAPKGSRFLLFSGAFSPFPQQRPYFRVRSQAAPGFRSPFPSGARLSEPVPRRRPAFKLPSQAPFSTVCAEEEERQSARARVRADDIPNVVILDLMPREVGF